MHKELTEKLEYLEQEKHELRRRLERREGEWEGRVAELEADVRQLQAEVERQQAQLREADREKSRAVQELSEQNQRLLEQLSRVRKPDTLPVHSSLSRFRFSRVQGSVPLCLRPSVRQIKMLSERKRELERRVGAILEENEALQGTADELQERALMLERQCHDKDAQLRQTQMELQEVRLSHRQLSLRLEELSEERSLQGLGSHHASLLSEIEQSMEQEELEQEREQVPAQLQLWEAYCQVRSLCSHLRGNDITDSALSTDSSMDESSETSRIGASAPSLSGDPSLSTPVCMQGSRRSDEEALEEQVKKLGEELRAQRELYEGEQSKAHASQEEALQLHSQVTLLSVEMAALKEERDRLQAMAEVKEPSEQLQKAIRDRDEAIAKKNAMEMELAKCKIDIMSLNSQLLDAIQQKLNLSQQLEAWQDDMHRVIDQQLMDKHQEEWRKPPYSFSGGAGRRGRPPPPSARPAGDKSLFSFFKKN
ncbi:BICL1 protein, partial [Atractosteus spatula]|nr:BICL1 protein [Atractosteus spatula]